MTGMMKRMTTSLAAVAILTAGCGKKNATTTEAPKADKTIQDCGSDTMVNLAQMWAEEYRKLVPSVSVEVSGGGSGVGIRDLSGGMLDIANSSRDITEAEKEQIKKNTGKDPVEHKVGYDAIAIYVHKDCPLDSITIEQLAAIFGEGGKIDKWSQLGVKLANDEIVRVSRQNNSGTYVFFREHVLNKKDFKLGSRDMSGSKDVVELVTRTPGAIGYSGMGYKTDQVKVLKVAKTGGEPAYEPSVASVHDKTYPLARALLMYTLGDSVPHVKAYIDWVLSPPGQAIVEQGGYVPMAQVK